MKLHLGCGLHTPDGWVNIDCTLGARLGNHRLIRKALSRFVPLTEWPAGIFIHDLRKPLPFEDNSVTAVYSSNAIEHLYRAEAERLLRECHRVLAPGGVARIIVPDLALIVREYCAKQPIGEPIEYNGAAELLNERLGMFPAKPTGGLRSFYYSLRNTGHKFVWDESALCRAFASAGFTNISRRAVFDSLIPDIESIERAEHFTERHDLCIEGIKAGCRCEGIHSETCTR